MSYYDYDTGLGSRHTVSFPTGDYWLDSYKTDFRWDDSRDSYLAGVQLWHLEKSGEYSWETVVIYNMPNPELDPDAKYRALAEALKLSDKPWKVRKFRFSVLAPKNRRMHRKLKEFGWHDQGR